MPISVPALLVVLLALALSAGLSALAARSSRRRSDPGDGPWWGALAVGLGYVVAHCAVATPSFPPFDVTDRIPFLALAAAVVAAFLAGGRGVLWARIVGSLGLAVLVSLVMLGPVLGAGEYSEETIFQLSAIAGVSCLAMLNVGLLDTPSRRLELWVGLTVVTAGAGVALILSNSAILFFLAGCLVLVSVASLLGGWGMPVGGGTTVGASVLTALLIEGSVYAFLPAIPSLLLASAPLLLWITRIGPIARQGTMPRAVIAASLVLIPVAIAIFLVYSSASSDLSGI